MVSKGKPTPIGRARRCLVDPFAQNGQVSIEPVVVERTQFNLHQRDILRNYTRELKKRQHSPPRDSHPDKRSALVASVCLLP